MEDSKINNDRKKEINLEIKKKLLLRQLFCGWKAESIKQREKWKRDMKITKFQNFKRGLIFKSFIEAIKLEKLQRITFL